MTNVCVLIKREMRLFTATGLNNEEQVYLH